jgi:hypothetical protein
LLLLVSIRRRQKCIGEGASILASLLLIHESYAVLRSGEREGNAKDSIIFNSNLFRLLVSLSVGSYRICFQVKLVIITKAYECQILRKELADIARAKGMGKGRPEFFCVEDNSKVHR